MTNEIENTKIEFGYCDIRHKHIDEIVEYLDSKKVEKYLIGLERVSSGTHAKTDGEHIHFVLYIEPETMKAFRQHMRTKYNLGSKNSGKAYYGFNRQEIRSLERLNAYTIKDKNIYSKNFTDEELQELIKISFPKNLSLFDAAIQNLLQQQDRFVITNPVCPCVDFREIEQSILKYYIINKQSTTKSTIKNISRTFLQLHFTYRDKFFNQIFDYTMN